MADKNYEGFSTEERAAMKDHAKELKKKATRNPAKAREDGTRDVLARIAEMGGADRELAQRIHEIVTTNAPELVPRLWYGMVAYSREGKVLCHFQDSAKFKTRYATFTFADNASLDDGDLWPVSFAITSMTPKTEATLATLVTKATA